VTSRRLLVRIERRVIAFVRQQDVLRPHEQVLLLLSGGADSMALLELVCAADRRLGLGLRLAALHVDYGLRGGDSTRDRRIVARACHRRAIPLHEVLLEGALQGSDFQRRARDLRFRRAGELAAEHGYQILATGHNADDQAETVLYRLAKYGAPSALVGMAPREAGVARPLLCLRAREVRDYCAAAGIEYGEDVSNATTAYARNLIRLSVLPALEQVNPRAVEALAEASTLARDERQAIDDLAARAWQRALVPQQRPHREQDSGAAAPSDDRDPGPSLDAGVLAAEPPAVRRLLVRRLAATVLGEHALIGRRLTAALDRLAAGSAGSHEVALRDGWSIVREYDRVGVRVAAADHACVPVVLALPAPAVDGCAGPPAAEAAFCGRTFRAVQTEGARGPAAGGVWLGLASPAASVTLRHPRRGERFEPLGSGGSTTVLAFLKEQKVPRAARSRALVLEVDGRTAWVEVGTAPGVLEGRVARGLRVSQSTAFTVHVAHAEDGPTVPRDRPASRPARRPAGAGGGQRMHESVERILISTEQLDSRVGELAAEISRDYRGNELLLVGVLRGAVFFMADLARRIELPCALDFMAVSSYGSATDSSGVVRILKDLDTDIAGRHVLIVEDVIDSGLTLNYLMKSLKARHPESLEICALLTKPSRRRITLNCRYVGFEIPDEFVVGYGLDLAEQFRTLNYIGTLRPEVIERITAAEQR